MQTTDVKDLESTFSVQDILQSRTQNYRLFSRLFLSPLSENELTELAAIDFSSIIDQTDEDSSESSQLFRAGLYDMMQALRRSVRALRHSLATDYTMCFDGITAIDDQVASPYESVYLDENKRLFGSGHSAVLKYYRREHVEIGAGFDLPMDHIAFELEFLAYLSTRMSEELDKNNQEEIIRLIATSEAFINEHILSWYEMFSSLAEKILTTRFYKGLLKAVNGYLELDKEMLHDIKDMIQE